jgi:hypothetical protein
MSVVAIVSFIVSALMVLSRFIQAAKPAWEKLGSLFGAKAGKFLAVLLPGLVSLVPQIVDLIQPSKTAVDLTSNLIAAFGIVVVGLFPKNAPTTESDAQSDAPKPKTKPKS